MPYVIANALLLSILVVPVLAATWIAIARRAVLRTPEERLLLAGVLVPLAALAEVLALSLLPIDRPLRTAFPAAPIAVAVACALWLWRRRADGSAELRCLGSRAGRLWRGCDRPARAGVILACAGVAFAFAWAVWSAGDEHDGAMYRELIAVQPYQDGRVGPVQVCFPENYTNAYPRTVELLYSWTILCTGGNVGFHLVNCWFLVLFALAAFVTAARSGLTRRRALWAGVFAATTPLPLYLTCVLLNDLAVSACIVAALAFALPRRSGAWTRADAAAFSIAAALGASAKFSALPAVGLLAILRTAATLRGPSAPGRSECGRAAFLAIAAPAAALAAAQYVRSWVLFGSPAWPVRIALGHWVIFDGPFGNSILMITARGAWPERWATAIYKLFQTTSQDANGSFGLLFAIGVVPAALLYAWGTLRRPSWTRLILLVMFWHVLLIPLATNLRYTLHALAPGYAMLLTVLARRTQRRHRSAVSAALLVLLAVNVFDCSRALVKEIVAQRRSVSILDPHRNRLWYTQFMYNPPGIPPETHQAIYAAMRPGERLAYAVICLAGLLYDPDYSYAIEFRTIERHARQEGHPPDPDAWRASLHRDRFDGVLVYVGSPEDTVLGANESGFEVVYATPGQTPWGPVRLYRARER